MLILLAFIIVFHITSAALLFISTIDNVSIVSSLFLPNTLVFLCLIKMKLFFSSCLQLAYWKHVTLLGTGLLTSFCRRNALSIHVSDVQG